MHDPMKRHEVQVLRRAGHSYAEIGELAGIPERTARRIVAEPAVESLDSDSGKDARRGRPPVADGFRKVVEGWLEGDPGLPTRELLRRAKEKGYDGGKSAFYALVRAARPPKSSLVTRFEGLPGEFSQHDFGEVWVTYTDGTRERLQFFASRLKFSRLCRVSLVEDQTAESLARAACEHFEFFGGIPLLAVFDRPKTVALKWKKDGTITEYNRVFAHAMFEMGVGVEVCWPYSPEQKGAVEQVVKYVKNSFFKVRQSADRDDLVAQLEAWHVEVNDELPNRATGEVPRARMKAESLRLRPLKVLPGDLAIRMSVRVGPTAMVAFEGNHYSMSPSAIGFNGTAFVYSNRIRFVAGQHTAEHPRKPAGTGARSTLPEHRSQRLAAVSGKRGKSYLRRQDILELGDIALTIVNELVFSKPDRWHREIAELHDLLQQHGPGPLRLAMHMAQAAGEYSADAVAKHLVGPVQGGLPT